ncbi:hypothetical protein [Nonlabens sp. Hel1_33_55]|uniref:hypothetical protein n=1 Tax=Nonlabens sp. Hel1_33_55 TaxID=1336802 RepID=UPI0012FE359D|nr:hypothetical protein [Nonlabens sp. Hel1_33_55]
MDHITILPGGKDEFLDPTPEVYLSSPVLNIYFLPSRIYELVIDLNINFFDTREIPFSFNCLGSLYKKYFADMVWKVCDEKAEVFYKYNEYYGKGFNDGVHSFLDKTLSTYLGQSKNEFKKVDAIWNYAIKNWGELVGPTFTEVELSNIVEIDNLLIDELFPCAEKEGFVNGTVYAAWSYILKNQLDFEPYAFEFFEDNHQKYPMIDPLLNKPKVEGETEFGKVEDLAPKMSVFQIGLYLNYVGKSVSKTNRKIISDLLFKNGHNGNADTIYKFTKLNATVTRRSAKNNRRLFIKDIYNVRAVLKLEDRDTTMADEDLEFLKRQC